MHKKERRQGSVPTVVLVTIGLMTGWALAGCRAPQARDLGDRALPPIVAADSTQPSPFVSPTENLIIVDSPRTDVDSDLVSGGSAIETWVVHTRACEQTMGVNPWPSITVGKLDENGGPLGGSTPEDLFTRMAGRPSVFLIHGNGYEYRAAIKEAIEVRAQLEALGGFDPETVFVVFDWPSERVRPDLVVDLNEKARRSQIAGYHLSRFLQAAPAGSRICFMGQSDGGRITLTTMHLLSGAALPAFLREPAAQLSSGRPDLRLRAVILEAAAEHDWLNPGNRLHQALPMCEALLNLRNSGDYALAFYSLGQYTGIGSAIGRVGIRPRDLKKLGPLAERVEEINHHSQSGLSHTLFPRVLEYPDVAPRIASYTSWNDLTPVTRR
ncbi:alpha/beta hydrolase [Singulisphaera sp. Ch08]|uniref:Alpha/beta hydrolase n=1 Tax=Singulisphaera sp. Ch08 TaxID=3120278 RepID=A0AAU7CK01_9BACT